MTFPWLLQAVRALSVPEPLQVDFESDNNPSNLSSIHSVPSLGAWNTPECNHLDTPASSPQAAAQPHDSPSDLNLQEHLQSILDAKLHSASAQMPNAQAATGQTASPAAQLPAQPDQVAAGPVPIATKAEAARPEKCMMAAQQLAEPATLPSIAEEEPAAALSPAEGIPLES